MSTRSVHSRPRSPSAVPRSQRRSKSACSVSPRGAHARFEIPAGEAFGARRPELIQTFSAATFAASTEIESHAAPGDVVRLTDGAGRQFAGVMQQRDADRVIVDFNHPLAGRPLLFSVQVIGVL